MTPDDDTHGSDRCRSASGGPDILAIKEPTDFGWSGCLDRRGTDCPGRFGYSTALRETDGNLYFNNIAVCFHLTILAEDGYACRFLWMTRMAPGFEGLAVDEQRQRMAWWSKARIQGWLGNMQCDALEMNVLI